MNKQLVKRIALGELPPIVLDTQLSAFLATNAAAYADEMAELTVQFLAGLIAVGTNHSRELVRAILPDAELGYRGDPPRFDTADRVDWFSRLAEYAASESAAVEALLRSAIPGATERDAGVPTTIEQTADLFLELLTRLEDLNTTYGDRYFAAVLGMSRNPDPSDATLKVVGPVGKTSTVRFAVQNNTSEKAMIRCVATDVRRTDGVGPAFEPEATITPNPLELPAGKEEVLMLRIRLAEQDFEQGPAYAGAVHVLGIADTVLEIPLYVRATPSNDEADPPTDETRDR
ncbi:MAG TPA: hypothetical protein VH496_19715 [Mycobacterium sp.]|jgi:hypothetical protein